MTSSDVHVENWSDLKLGNALPISYGKALRSDARDSSGPFPVFGSAGKIGLHSSALTSGPTLVIGRKGSAGAVHYSPDPCWVIDTAYFSEVTDQLELKFAYYLLQHSRLGTLDRSTAVPSLGRDDYDAVSICIPDKPEQKHIVDKIEELFSDLDAGVVALERARAKLKRYRASVLNAAVEGRLTEKWRAEQKAKGVAVEPAAKLLERILAERRKKWEAAQIKKFADADKTPPKGWQSKYSEPSTPDSGNLSELPQGWSWATTDQLFWYVTSGSRGWAQYYSEDGAAFLRIGNLDHFTTDLDLRDIQHVTPPIGAEGARTRVEKNDILISITADVGMIAHVADNIEKAYINQHIALGRCSDASLASFTAWFLASSVGQKQFKSLQRGATKVGLGLDDIRAVNVPLPSIGEQTEIVSQIEAALSSITHAETEINRFLARAAGVRQAILKRAFEGRLV